jgi:hypothetical protein
MKLVAFYISIIIYVGAQANAIHPYSITQANADLQENTITLSIKANAEDLVYFQQLEFDSLFNIRDDELQKAAQRHIQTIKSGFYILDQNGNPLSSTLSASNFSSLNAKKMFNAMELLKFPLYYTLEFKLKENTSLLVFHQELSNAGLPAVTLLSISKNGNQLVQNIELTKERPFTIARDVVSIGNPSESSFMLSYITLTDTRILHELTIPLPILKSFIPFDDTDNKTRFETIRKFITDNSTVQINDMNIEPEVTLFGIQKDSLYTMGATSLVSIRVEYPLKTLPKEVSVSWENFNWQVRWFRSLIDAFGVQHEHNFSRFQPTYKVDRKIDIKKED